MVIMWEVVQNMNGQEKGCQGSASIDAPKKNHLYALHTMGEQQTSSDVVMGKLKLFTVDV